MSKEQLNLLSDWDSNRDSQKLLQTMAAIYPEFLRLNKVLSEKVGIEEERELCEKVFELVL